MSLLKSLFGRNVAEDRPTVLRGRPTRDGEVLAGTILKSKRTDRENLVFGFALVPHPMTTDAGNETLRKFGHLAGGTVEGSLEERAERIETAYSRVFPSDHDKGVWTSVVATFEDHVFARVETFEPQPQEVRFFKVPFVTGSDPEDITFGAAEEVELEFVAKTLASELARPIAAELGQPKEDLQHDRTPLPNLERAAYDYVLDSRVGGVDHAEAVGELVESVMLTPDKWNAILRDEEGDLPAGINDDALANLPQGWWLGFHVDDATMDKVEGGELEMFSVGGETQRVPEPAG